AFSRWVYGKEYRHVVKGKVEQPICREKTGLFLSFMRPCLRCLTTSARWRAVEMLKQCVVRTGDWLRLFVPTNLKKRGKQIGGRIENKLSPFNEVNRHRGKQSEDHKLLNVVQRSYYERETQKRNNERRTKNQRYHQQRKIVGVQVR